MILGRSRARLAGRGLAAVGFTMALWPVCAWANPGLEGTRNLSMGSSARASATGNSALLANPAGLVMSQQFSFEADYQYDLRHRTHGVGAFISDSLNNPRFGIGLGYVLNRGTPRIGYVADDGSNKQLDTLRLGHEVMGVFAVNTVKNYFSLAVKPKYQFSVHQYIDDNRDRKNLRDRQSAFGFDAAITINILNWVRIGLVGENLTGVSQVAYRPERVDEPDAILPTTATDGSPLDVSELSPLADYQRSFAHSIAVYPLGKPNFSLNFDGYYDFTSYWKGDANEDNKIDEHVRLTYGGSGEFIVGPVPIRVGGYWDGRGPGADDNRGYVSAGTGFIKPAAVGGVGVDAGIGFTQQVTGDDLETYIGAHVGLRFRPDL